MTRKQMKMKKSNRFPHKGEPKTEGCIKTGIRRGETNDDEDKTNDEPWRCEKCIGLERNGKRCIR